METNDMELVSSSDLMKALSINSIPAQKFSNIIFKLLKLHQINSLYSNSISDSAVLFIENLLREIQIDIDFDEEELKQIPLTGKFISVSNHPFGALDGLILIYILAKRRNDIKIFANYVLQNVEPLKDLILAVDPFEKNTKIGKNVRTLVEGKKQLAQGKPIALFPAGEVSAMKKLNLIEDKEWNSNSIKFIKTAKAPVLPIYFHGSNSIAFHILGMINPKLRTLKLPSELTNKKNKTIRVRIGNCISVEEQDNFKDNKEFGRFLRARTYALGNRLNVNKFFKFSMPTLKTKMPIIDAIHPLVIQNEIAQIPQQDLLFKHGNYHLYSTAVGNIPNTILEIGRIREVTFRNVGEGTNKPLDVDEFDLNYEQLFIWDNTNQKIVGGYRIGLGQKLYKLHKKKGFYLNSLFKFDKEFEAILKQSIELGRSFIIKEYQRRPFPLFLLWKGVLQVLLKHEEYRYILGPVSISNSFADLSKNIIIDYLSQNHFDHKHSLHVKARKKFKIKYDFNMYKMFVKSANTIEVLDDIIDDIEKRKHKIPILLKKYLDQNATLLAFNRDPKFNNAVDGLMMLDVFDIPLKTLKNLAKDHNNPEEVTHRFYNKYCSELVEVPLS